MWEPCGEWIKGENTSFKEITFIQTLFFSTATKSWLKEVRWNALNRFPWILINGKIIFPGSSVPEFQACANLYSCKISNNTRQAALGIHIVNQHNVHTHTAPHLIIIILAEKKESERSTVAKSQNALHFSLCDINQGFFFSRSAQSATRLISQWKKKKKKARRLSQKISVCVQCPVEPPKLRKY